MSFGPCRFSSLGSATIPLQRLIAAQKKRKKKYHCLPNENSFFFSRTHEVSVGKAAVTEVQYQLKDTRCWMRLG